jgi:hypothetical protein
MTGPERRPRAGHFARRVRRWARHTPNGEIALVLISLGTAFVVLAAVIAVVAL